MNYLAHAYFSFQHPQWTVGNLISDFVKGRRQYDYPPAVQIGIRLHRTIDEFTDSHPATKRARELFRPYYRLYAGAFVDVVYDYFLANDPTLFATENALDVFARHTYDVLLAHYDVLPEAFQQMYHRMRQQNWLLNYRHPWGLQKSFAGVVYRSRYLNDSTTAFLVFEQHRSTLQEYYLQFIPDLKQMLADWLEGMDGEGFAMADR